MLKFHSFKNKFSSAGIAIIILGFGFFHPNNIRANTLSVTQNNQNSAPVLDYVAINNEVVDESQSGRVQVVEGDAVKIAGQAQPGAKITIFFGKRQLETTVDQYGNWFVLFSVLNLEDGFYDIQAKLEKSENFSSATTENIQEEEQVVLSTLSLGDNPEEMGVLEEKEGPLATQTNWLNSTKGKQFLRYLAIIILLTGITVGIIILSKDERILKKIEEIKEKFSKRQNEQTKE